MDTKGVAIPMRDAKELVGDVYLPRAKGRFPTILILTPYNRAYIGAALPSPEYKTAFFDRDVFAYVVVDWRGFFGSKAARSARAKLGEDGYDTVEWIARQPWSNGNVGMWGISAPGKAGFYTAEQRPPHLKCIAPIVASYGYRYKQFYHGGVLKRAYVDTLKAVGWGPRLGRMLAHPGEDEFWKWVEAANQTSRINLPVLLVTGWYDLHVEGIIDSYYDIRERGGPAARDHVRLLIGPWHHSAPGKEKQGELKFPEAVRFYDAELRRFFDHWLRDRRDNGWEKEPPIRYFLMGSNEWKHASDWPPPAIKEVAYYLRGEGKLAETPPPARDGNDSFRFDPANPSPSVGGALVYKSWDSSVPKLFPGPMDQRAQVEHRSDLLSYSSDELPAAVAATGAVRVRLHVSSDREVFDVAARLADVHPDGRSMLVTDGIQRVRASEPARSGPDKTAGTLEVTITLSTTAHTFKEGHRIRLLISSSNYPRFDTDPGREGQRQRGTLAGIATTHVHRNLARPSALLLPVLDAKPAEKRVRRERPDE